MCGVVARNAAREILLMRRADGGTWGFPAEASSRARPGRPPRSVSAWMKRARPSAPPDYSACSDPSTQTHTYPSGERVQFVGVVFTAAAESPGGHRDSEASDVRFFPLDDLPQPLFEPDRPVLTDCVSRRAEPVIA